MSVLRRKSAEAAGRAKRPVRSAPAHRNAAASSGHTPFASIRSIGTTMLCRGVLLALFASAVIATAQNPVLIKELISREVSIHVGGVQSPEIREVASREVTVFVESGPLTPFGQIISREFSIVVSDDAPPPALGNFQVTPSPNGTRVTLNWSGYNPWAVRDVARFDIYLSDRPFSSVAGMTPVMSVGAETLGAVLQNLPEWRDHFLAIVPVDARGNFLAAVTYSAAYVLSPEVVSREVTLFNGAEPEPPHRQVMSREVSVVVTTPTPPEAIASVARTVSPDGATVTLNWSGYNEWLQRDVARYDIYYSSQPFSGVGGRTPLVSVPAGTFSHTFTGLPSWRDHSFAVVAVDAAGNFLGDQPSFGAYVLSPQTISREVSLFNGAEPNPPYREVASREVSLVVADPTVPEPVTGVTSGFDAEPSTEFDNAIALTWLNYNELYQRDVVAYRIYLGTAFFDTVEGRTPYAVIGAERNRHTLLNLPSGAIYYIAVVAVDVEGRFNPVVYARSAQVSDLRLDFLLALGSVDVLAGTDAAVPVRLWSDPGLGWLRFQLTAPQPPLSGFQWEDLDASVTGSSILELGNGAYELALNLDPSTTPIVNRALGRLAFSTTVTGRTAKLPLTVTALAGSSPSIPYRGTNALSADGSVVIIVREPYLVAHPGGRLELKGVPGARYGIERSTSGAAGPWGGLTNLTLTNLTALLTVPTNGITSLYRGVEIEPASP